MRPVLPLLLLTACAGDPTAPDGVTTDTTTDTPPPTDTTAPTDTTPPTDDTGTVPTPDPVSYATDVEPLIINLCATCHHAGSAGDYDFTDPWDPVTGFVGRANSWVPNGSDETLLVDPGNPGNSFLLVKIEDTTLKTHIDGAPMPWAIDRLAVAELADVEQWINDGAQNDAFFSSQVAPIFGTEISFRGAAGKCTWCHYPGSPTGVNVLDVFDPVEGLVGRASGFGGTIVIPGDADNSVLMTKLRGDGPGEQMPMHARRITTPEITTVRQWIAEGALDN